MIMGWLLNKPALSHVQGRELYHGTRTISRFVLRYSDKVLAVTPTARHKLCRIMNRVDTQVIPLGVELSRSHLDSQECRKELNIAENKNVLLYAGRLAPEKGVEYLIRAMPKIIKHLENTELIICGDGPERARLVPLAQELQLASKIQFVGQVPHHEVFKYMKAANLLVLPSLEEDLGTVNLEAMASGLPIVASRVGGIPDIVEDGINGFLVSPRSPAEIANKVVTLLKDEELCARISKNNLVKVKDYDWVHLIKRYEQACLEVLDYQ